MQKDFRTVFQKWQSNKATDEEVSELEEMLRLEVYQQQLMTFLSDTSVSHNYDAEITGDRKRVLLQEVIDLVQQEERTRASKRKFRIASAVAAAFVLVLAGVWIMTRQDALQRNELASIQVIDKRFVKLPDGTAITLNEGSTITYNSDEFGKEKRELVLSGEAFFDVAHDPDRPFIVRTDQINTTVLGTAFNLSAYADKPIVVTVVRGKVKVGSIQREFDTLLPNQELVIESTTLTYERKDVKAEDKIEWMASYLLLNNVTMQEAAQMISKRYNTQVVLGDSSLTDCRISIFFVKNESLERVLETVSLAKGGDYTIKDGLATINGQCE